MPTIEEDLKAASASFDSATEESNKARQRWQLYGVLVVLATWVSARALDKSRGRR